MVQVYVWAEGQTEQTFADVVLRPYLATRGVHLHKPMLIAHARKKGRIHRGGGGNYLPMKNDMMSLLLQLKNQDVFFTTMIDLYAIHSEFPGLDDAEKLRHMPYARVEHLEEAWQADMADPRFVPFIQLHEYEAYLFTDPSAFARVYDDAGPRIERLKKIASDHKSPELIDDGRDTAPSKRIIKVFPGYGKAKRVFGPLVGKSIGIDAIRSKCKHFDRWVTKLESLGERGAA